MIGCYRIIGKDAVLDAEHVEGTQLHGCINGRSTTGPNKGTRVDAHNAARSGSLNGWLQTNIQGARTTAVTISEQGLALPLHMHLSHEEIDSIVNELTQMLLP